MYQKLKSTIPKACDHLIFYRKLRKKDVAKFHVQFSISLFLMLVVFVAGIDRTENRAGCITVGVLLHYLTLVAWMWMAAEAVLLFQKLVVVFMNVTVKYLIIVSAICWSGSKHLSIINNFVLMYSDSYIPFLDCITL